MSELPNKRCVPCKMGDKPLDKERLDELCKELEEGWELLEGKTIKKRYLFKDFKEGLAFVSAIGKVAEEEGHHPDIALSWGKVGITLSTHKVGGLTESDFILAAKIDVIYTSMVK